MTTRTHRYTIVKRGDGTFYVRTYCFLMGTSAMLHADFLPTIEAAHAEIALQKARRKAELEAERETIVHTEDA
jgi:hypothetical protein